MTPEVSLAVTNLLPYLQSELEVEEYWQLQDLILKAKTVEDLPDFLQELLNAPDFKDSKGKELIIKKKEDTL